MDLNEKEGAWEPDSGTYDLRSPVQSAEYNKLRAKSERGEIRAFKDGLKEKWTAYNQKEGDFIVICTWFYLKPPESGKEADLDGP